MSLYLGIDPGKSGGFCVISTKGVVYAEKRMPLTERDIWMFIDSYEISAAAIERVHAMPKQGVTSTFTFGTGYGGLRMALVATGIPFSEVQPRTWQKEFGIIPRKKTETKQQFKDRIRAKCQQLFPSLSLWKESVTYQRCVCDAILIAEFCRRSN